VISLVQAATQRLAAQLALEAQWVVAAPGRVNLIGEHTDYNDGYVLPMAIERYTVIAAAPVRDAGPRRLRVHSLALEKTVDIPLEPPIEAGEPGWGWASYVRGVVAVAAAATGARLPSLDLAIASNVPLGSGLASSAALEVATATLIEAVTGRPFGPLEKARLARRAEHEHAGVPCGLMDQLTAVLGDASGALLIDCRAETARLVRLTDPSVSVLVCDTNVRHDLGDGTYARRRAECEEAARLLGVGSLRDATAGAVDGARQRLGDVRHRRARHVVTENARTVAAAAALDAGNFEAAGDLMYRSHHSLCRDFEVSCGELDTVVALAEGIGRAGGVLGARMTGGGFGGCAVLLVRTDRVVAVTAALATGYQGATGRALTAFVSRPARGAHVVGEP
jgi:galactokinase